MADRGSLLSRERRRTRLADLPPGFDSSGVRALVPVLRLPGRDIGNELPELHGVAGALLPGRGHAP